MDSDDREEMNTTTEMLPGEGDGADPALPTRRRAPRWVRRTTWATGLTLSVLGALVVAASLVSSGYVAYKPGSATPAEDRVDVNGATAYPPTGDILFLTVSVDRMSKLEKWWYDRNDDVDMQKESDAFPKGRKANTQVNAQLMTQSKSTAELVALQYLGYDVLDNTGARILSIVAGSPSEGHLHEGDTIIAIEDTSVKTKEEATTRLRSTKSGQSIVIRVEDENGVARDESIVLGTRPDPNEQWGFMGVSLGDRIRQKDPLPIDLTIDSGRVGGDSAGLAFTLSIIDELTPGELTGGHRIAVTGTMQSDGTVGPIGGIRQKVVAARKAKAELMLVPEGDNYEDAVAKAGDTIKIVAVKDLEAALAALSDFGGNASELALGKPPSAN